MILHRRLYRARVTYDGFAFSRITALSSWNGELGFHLLSSTGHRRVPTQRPCRRPPHWRPCRGMRRALRANLGRCKRLGRDLTRRKRLFLQSTSWLAAARPLTFRRPELNKRKTTWRSKHRSHRANRRMKKKTRPTYLPTVK